MIRDGAVWSVYVATSAQNSGSNVTELQFESAGAGRFKQRYSRPVDGPLLDALHNGTPVSRARLQEELDLAFRAAGADGSVPPSAPVATESSVPATEETVDG